MIYLDIDYLMFADQLKARVEVAGNVERECFVLLALYRSILEVQ